MVLFDVRLSTRRRPFVLPLRAIALAVALLTAAAQPSTATDDELRELYQRPETIPFPADNPYTPEKAALGKMLYFDPRLSGGQNMNCASCHNPSFGWEVPLAGAIGSMNQPLARHAPTVLNQAWGSLHFWDGRAPSLEEQAKGPIEAPAEMNLPLPELVRRLQAIEGYRHWFDRTFPQEGITEDTVVAAIATYERTVVSGYAPFDAWVEGDEGALSEAAKRGFALFNGKAKCAGCHMGWNFTDDAFHDIGLPSDDVGRAGVTDDPDERHAFKTPGLRDLTQRAPFMHDGSIETLEQVVLHYATGGIRRPSLSPMMEPLDLTERDVADLVAFMESLTGDDAIVPLPILPY